MKHLGLKTILVAIGITTLATINTFGQQISTPQNRKAALLKKSNSQISSTSGASSAPATIKAASIPHTLDPQRFFPKADLMPGGAYYYPEGIPANKWERDIKKMASLGFKFIHMAEFSWSRLEPTEGKFEFGWLDTCVALSAKYGLKVILCTPSPCPPTWLCTNHPEILIHNEEGRAIWGGRLQGSWSSPLYRKYVAKITQMLGQRYANNPAIWGWQLDNEPSHGNVHYDYSQAAQDAFIVYLKAKYTTLDNLNTHWGTNFWSQTYSSWSQIKIPTKLLPAAPNPHALLDFQTCNDLELSAFLGLQYNTLRQYIAPAQFVTSNFAYYKFLPEIDLWSKRGVVDFSSFTMYLLSTYLDKPKGPLAHRLGSGLGLSFAGEFAKSIAGVTGCMELQPGQINWGDYNPMPLPGAVNMWVWHNFGFGSAFACTYRFDRPLQGAEQYHAAVMSTDGVTVDSGGKEFVKALAQIQDLKKFYNPTATAQPLDYQKRKITFLWKQLNILDQLNYPHTQLWNPWDNFFKYYSAAKRSVAPVSFLPEDAELNVTTTPYLILSSYQLMEAPLVNKLLAYVKSGGNLIMSCRTGQKDNGGALHQAKMQSITNVLTGVEIQFNDQMSALHKGKISLVGHSEVYTWNVFAEILKPLENPNLAEKAQVIATYQDQFYAPAAAATFRRLGKGTVTYVGAHSTGSNEGNQPLTDLETDILQYVYNQTGNPAPLQAPYFFTEFRDGFGVSVNYTSVTQMAPVPDGKTILVGNKEVMPGQACIWSINK